MAGFVDIHNHILPGLDDGPESVEEALHMLKIAQEEGISVIFCTVHNHPHKGRACPERIYDAVDQFQQLAARYRIRLVPANEVYYMLDVPDRLIHDEVLTIDGDRTVLMEFRHSDSYYKIRNAVIDVQSAGFEVLLAHCERYITLLNNIEEIYDLRDMGVLLQINAASITGDLGRKTRRFVKRLMLERLVYCVGTDAHSSGTRSPRMKQAYEYVCRKYGTGYADRIFKKNAARFIH